MKLHQLRDFVAVAEHGGIRAAARELGLSQPAVTKSIQQLESELQTPLFERSARGLRPTEAGHAFFARTRVILNEVSRAQDEMGQWRLRQQGQLSIAMTSSVLMSLFPDALMQFQKRYPQVKVRIMERSLDDAIRDLRRGEPDFVVVSEPLGDLGAEFTLSTLQEDVYAVVARIGHPRSGVRALSELLDQSWVVTRTRGAHKREFELFFEKQGLPVPRIALQCESALGLLSILMATDFLAVVPSRWHATPIAGRAVRAVEIGQPIKAASTCVIRRSAVPLTPAAEAFVAALDVEARARARH